MIITLNNQDLSPILRGKPTINDQLESSMPDNGIFRKGYGRSKTPWVRKWNYGTESDNAGLCRLPS